jgi:hypothetical protein
MAPNEIIIDSNFEFIIIISKTKFIIRKGINIFRSSNQLYSTVIRCNRSLKGGENYRIVIEEQYNLIILTVLQMTEWKEILEDPMLYTLQDCSFYINSDRLYENDLRSKNIYYIHYIRRMRAGNRFWGCWKDENQSILCLQILSVIKFKEIFKDPKFRPFKDDKFWLGTKLIVKDDYFPTGYYTGPVKQKVEFSIIQERF